MLSQCQFKLVQVRRLSLFNLENKKEVLDLSNNLMKNVQSLDLKIKGVLRTGFKELVQLAENIMKNHAKVSLKNISLSFCIISIKITPKLFEQKL